MLLKIEVGWNVNLWSNQKAIQWGSEYWTSSILELSKVDRSPNSPGFRPPIDDRQVKIHYTDVPVIQMLVFMISTVFPYVGGVPLIFLLS